MYKKTKIFFILLFILILPYTTIPVKWTSQAQETGVTARPRVQFGYWEIIPTIEDLSEDWWVGTGTYYKGSNTVDTTTVNSQTFLTDQQIATGNWLIDPDGRTLSAKEERVAVSEGSIRYNDPVSAADRAYQTGASSVKPLDYDDHTYGDSIYCGTSLQPVLRTNTAPIKTEIYRSAPPVGFSIGAVFPSTFDGVHWTNAGGGYTNLSKALDSIAEVIVIPNYVKNVTYTYRKIFYSMKVTFWTQGVALLQEKTTLTDYLMAYYYQPDSNLAGVGCDGAYFVPAKSYTASFDYLSKSIVEANPAIYNLKIKMIAPLWTSRASEIIESPSGDFKAIYNNTWIGFLGAEVTNIAGGHINPDVGIPSSWQNSANTAEAAAYLRQNTASVDTLEQAPTSSETIVVGSTSQIVTPAPSQQALQGTSTSVPPAQAYTIPSSSNYPQHSLNTIGGDELGDPDPLRVGFPTIAADGLVQDPQFYEPYFLTSNTAQGGVLGQLDQEFVNQFQDYTRVGGLPDDPQTDSLNYNDAQANYINVDEVGSDITEVDRQYAKDLALSQDIPNELTFTLGGVLKPALHTWKTKVHWFYKEFSNQVWGWFDRHTKRTTFQPNTRDVMSGQEIVNVYTTYTITFPVVVIDRYDHNIVPQTNFYSGEQLAPWVKTILHNNTYDEHYEFFGEFLGPSESVFSLFSVLFWLLFGGFTLLFMYRGMNNRQKIVSETGGEESKTTSFIKSFWPAILYGFILALVVQLIINIFTGGFPWNLFF